MVKFNCLIEESTFYKAQITHCAGIISQKQNKNASRSLLEAATYEIGIFLKRTTFLYRSFIW